MTLLIKQIGVGSGFDLEATRRERDLIDQMNRALQERDQRLSALEATPEIFAFAGGTTDGAGGITTRFAFGCTLVVAGSTVSMRFDTPRPSRDYVYGAMFVGALARMPTSPGFVPGSYSEEFADTRFFTDGGVAVSASTTSFSAIYWAMGPRP